MTQNRSQSRQLRIALAQVDVTVGDLEHNAERILDWTKEAAARGAHLVAFPEMAVTGYPPEDLVLRESFRLASVRRVAELAGELAAAGVGEVAVLAGYLDTEGGPRNAAAVLHGGGVAATYFKHHLPNYGVFDEARYFLPGDRFTVVRLHGVDIAVTVCEDMWQDGGPFTIAGQVGVDVVVNINGSPYEWHKDDVRLPLARRRAAEARAPVAYVNLVGGQDELVYDGASMVVDPDGTLLARAPQYVETLLLFDLTVPATPAAAREPAGAGGTARTATTEMAVHHRVISAEPVPAYPAAPPVVADTLPLAAEVWGAVVTGLRDYARKNGFSSTAVAVSGGIDSAVVAAVACDALGPASLYCLSLPSAYSSEHSRADAEDLAGRLGCHFQLVPIAPMMDAYQAALGLTGLAEENLQSRIRGTILMGLSNQNGHLVLATGNKTECAVGFSTLYGDTVGGFAPLKDVPKTLVWELARWRNADAEQRGQVPPIPENSIAKPPSAELRPGQLDTDSLPPYQQLDAILADYVDRDLGWSALVARGHDPAMVARVIRMVDAAEYKRRQFPPGPKISLRAFGRDRRLPIANRWMETPPAGT